MSVGILKYFTLKRRSSLATLTAFCLKYSLLREYFACKQGSIESEDNCHVPSDNGSGSSHTRGPYEHFTIDNKAK